MAEDRGVTRQERRARKLAAKREGMHKHGGSLAGIYAAAVRKRAARALNAARGRRPQSGSEDRR